MSALTTYLGLYKPGGGSSGLITPDEVVDIDRINGNSDLIDAFASSWGLASRQTRDFTGPAASLATIVAAAGGARLGDTYQETDVSKRLLKFDGTNWNEFAGGLYIVRPTSTAVNNGSATVNADGSITVNACNQVDLEGVFSALFRRYLVEFAVTWDVNSAYQLQLKTAGAADATNYQMMYWYNSNATTITSQQTTGATGFSSSGIGIVKQTGRVSLDGPNLAANTIIDLSSWGPQSGTPNANFRTLNSGEHTVASIFTGLRMFGSSSGKATGWIKIYGMA